VLRFSSFNLQLNLTLELNEHRREALLMGSSPCGSSPQVLPSSCRCCAASCLALQADRKAVDPQCPLPLCDLVVHRVCRDSFKQKPLPLGTCLYVPCLWHWTLLNTSGHLSCIFLPANGTGMLLFDIKSSQVGVTLLAIPGEELLVETVLSCL